MTWARNRGLLRSATQWPRRPQNGTARRYYGTGLEHITAVEKILLDTIKVCMPLSWNCDRGSLEDVRHRVLESTEIVYDACTCGPRRTTERLVIFPGRLLASVSAGQRSPARRPQTTETT